MPKVAPNTVTDSSNVIWFFLNFSRHVEDVPASVWIIMTASYNVMSTE